MSDLRENNQKTPKRTKISKKLKNYITLKKKNFRKTKQDKKINDG